MEALMQHLKKEYGMRIVKYYGILFACLCTKVVVPLGISWTIDKLTLKECIQASYWGALLILFLSEFILTILKGRMNIKLSNKIAFRIEGKLLQHIAESEYSVIRKYDNAYLAQRVNNDAVIFGDYFCEKFPYFVFDVLGVLSILVVIICKSVYLGFILTVGCMVYVIFYCFFSKYMYVLVEDMLQTQAEFFAMLSGQFRDVLFTKIHALKREKENEFDETTSRFYNASIKYLNMDVLLNNSGLSFGRILYLLVFIATSIRITKMGISPGYLTALILYIDFIITKLNEAFLFAEHRQKYLLAKKRIMELLNMDSEKQGTFKCRSVESIEMINAVVDFGNKVIVYPRIQMKKGKVYVINGENGAGKSTIINLLLGIEHLKKGEVCFNGVSLEKIDKEDLRRKLIAVATQDSFLCNGTLEQNILYGVDNKNDLLMKECTAGFLEYAENRGGLLLRVRKNNTELSGGEKQKIVISRAFSKAADVYVFDEPYNNLDESSRKLFLELVSQIKDKIVIIISHDLEINRIADEVIAL